MDIREELSDHREAILRIVSQHGGRNVRIFGSVARGEAGEQSDVDVLISLDPDRSLLDLIAIKQDLEDLLGREVDVVTEASISPYIRDRVLGEAHRLSPAIRSISGTSWMRSSELRTTSP